MFGWLFEWIWNQVPWYVPLVFIIIAIGFCWQWIAPIWFILPGWLRWTIGMVIAIIIAVQYGRNRGEKVAKERQASLNANAVKQMTRISENVQRMPPNAVSDALRRNGWMRDD